MVKIPSMDDLKKIGSGLIDHAKAVNFAEMVDKMKSGIKPVQEINDETIRTLLQNISNTMAELTAAEAMQQSASKKMEKQLEELAKVLSSYFKPTSEQDDKNETTK